jgi:hypothetical protein
VYLSAALETSDKINSMTLIKGIAAAFPFILLIVAFIWVISSTITKESPVSIIIAALLSGTLLFIFQQVLQKIIIEPVLELRSFRGEVADRLAFHAQYWANPFVQKGFNDEIPSQYKEAQYEIRGLSSELRSKSMLVIGHDYFSFIGLIPKKQAITSSCGELTGLSNSLWASSSLGLKASSSSPESNHRRVDKIEKHLKISIQ